MNKFFVFLCVMLISVGIVRIANALDDIDITNHPNDTGVGSFKFGDDISTGQEATVGQTIKIPATESPQVLESFEFSLNVIFGFPPRVLIFKAFVMEWNDNIGEKHAIGPILYESEDITTNDDIEQTFVLKTNPDPTDIGYITNTFADGNCLQPDHHYVAFFTTTASPSSTDGASFKTKFVDFVPEVPVDPYPDGIAVRNNSGKDFSLLTEPWALSADTDLSFKMAFSSCSPVDQLEALVSIVVDLNASNGIINSLDTKLDSALNAIDDINANNDVAAINSLQAFINAVLAQSGNQIPSEEADALISAAQAIIDSLGG